jgi:hypothetical protein
MNRQEILASYDIDLTGRIHSPGKFEGEQLYVPYFWECFLNGGADYDNGHVLGFNVTKEDKKEFPELRRRKMVKLIEQDDGFVVEV